MLLGALKAWPDKKVERCRRDYRGLRYRNLKVERCRRDYIGVVLLSDVDVEISKIILRLLKRASVGVACLVN